METTINLIEPGVLAALILAGTQILLKFAPRLKGQIATLIITVVFGAVAYFVVDGIKILEIVIALTGEIAVYDLLVKSGYITQPLKPAHKVRK